MYVPVYRHGLPIDTVEQRRAAILGWVYSPYRMTDMISGTLGGWNVLYADRQISLQVYDGAMLTTDTLLYDSRGNADKALASTALVTRLTPVDYAGRRWTLRFSQTGGLASTANYSSVWLVLFGGTSISLLLFGLMIALLRTNVTARRIADQMTTELRESEEKYRVVFNNEVYAICIFDLETLKLLEVNQAYVRLYGYSREEVVSGMTIHDITTEHEASDAATRQSISEGTILIPLRYHRKKDGTIFPVEIVGGAYVWRGRKVMFGLTHEITERQQAEEALRNTQWRLKSIIEGTQVGTWEWNVQTGETVFNEKWAQIIGYTLDELAPVSIKTWERLCHPDDLKQSDELMERHFAGELLDYDYECRLKHKDGRWVWVLDRGRVITRTSDGKPLMMFGTHLDITERKREESLLAVSESRYRRLFEAAQDGILILDAETGMIEDVNLFLIELLGYSREQFIKKELWEIGFFKDIAANQAKLLELQQNQYARYENLPLETADGRNIHVEFVSNVYLVDNKKVVQCNIRDVSDRIENEERVRSLNVKLEQLASMDGLTGINNHRSLLQHAEREFDIAMRYRPPLSMIFFDIDHFKQVNDTFGHAVGDQALIKTIQTVCSNLRSTDLIGRYGGDEFVILLPQTSAQDALPLAERIHASIAAMRLDTDKGALALTISIGIAQTIRGSSQTDTVESLLLRADQALYAAKQGGRNRTVIFNQDATGGQVSAASRN